MISLKMSGNTEVELWSKWSCSLERPVNGYYCCGWLFPWGSTRESTCVEEKGTSLPALSICCSSETKSTYHGKMVTSEVIKEIKVTRNHPVPSFWRLSGEEVPSEIGCRRLLVQDFGKHKIILRASTGVPQKLGSSNIISYALVLNISLPVMQTENEGIVNSSKLVRESELTTNIQVWLADCGRWWWKFNNFYMNSNTQVFFVDSSSAMLPSALFSWLPFLKKKTLKEANLCNAVIVQQCNVNTNSLPHSHLSAGFPTDQQLMPRKDHSLCALCKASS